MESNAERFLKKITINVEALGMNSQFMREFSLNQTRKNIDNQYGKELARFISYEDFSLRDLADFQEEQGIELNDDDAYGMIAVILQRIGDPESTNFSIESENISAEELPIELLFAVSCHLEMLADQIEDNRDMPTVELINSYLDMRVGDIKEESEPTDAKLFPEL